tara:strand:+ start:16434 stop:18431 length:1998 start_codon:yes stop_codon:yes gene_type:complete
LATSAQITIDATSILGEIHNHLYGANLEHYGQSIYGGHWSEMLQDRKFAGQDHMYIGLQEGLRHEYSGFGVVRPWLPINPDKNIVRFVHDNTVFYSGRQCQRITVEIDDGRSHGIKQENLFLEEDRSYKIRLVLRGPIDEVDVDLDGENWSITKIPNDWATYETVLKAQRTNSNGILAITFTGIGSLRIGCTSVMPDDNVLGHRKDVINVIKDWSPTFLRWPGGNFVSAYHWLDGVGPIDKRPTRLDPAFNLLEPNDVGTDEFIQLCRLLNSDPVLTVNMGDGTPEEAAAWVSYCNGSKNTEYGKLRIENGFVEPYDVKTWFVGNELFGNWQVGHVDPETYARKYLEFSRAMRAADPNIELIAVGVPIDLYGRWNEMLAKHCGSELEELSLHYYSIRTEMMRNKPDGGNLYNAKVACSIEVESMIDQTIDVLTSAGAPNVPIAFDEWNTYVDAKAPDFIGNYDLADGIYVGGVMNGLIRRPGKIKRSCIYNLINAMAPYRVTPTYNWSFQTDGGPQSTYWLANGKTTDGPPSTWKMPQALVLELFTKFRGEKSIQCNVESPTFSTEAAGTLPAYDAIPVIDAAATMESETGKIYLSIINRHETDKVNITLNSSVVSGEIYLVKGDSPLATNTAINQENVFINHQNFDLKFKPLEIPPHSFAMLVL